MVEFVGFCFFAGVGGVVPFVDVDSGALLVVLVFSSCWTLSLGDEMGDVASVVMQQIFVGVWVLLDDLARGRRLTEDPASRTMPYFECFPIFPPFLLSLSYSSLDLRSRQVDKLSEYSERKVNSASVE